MTITYCRQLLLIACAFIIGGNLMADEAENDFVWPKLPSLNSVESFWTKGKQNDYLKSLNSKLDPRKQDWKKGSDRKNTPGAKVILDYSRNLFMSFEGERGSGGGGDAVYCAQEDKLYSLDYKLSPVNEISSLLNNTSCNDHIQTIYLKLKEKSPMLARGLREFMNGLVLSFSDNISLDKLYYYHFFLSNSELIEVKDELINGKKLCDKGSAKLYQAAVRLPTPSFVKIAFDNDLFQEIKKNPFQCSYLLLHEWIRDFIFEANDNRKFVHYLHSDDFFNEKEMQFPGLGDKKAEVIKKQKEESFEAYLNFLRNYGDIATSPINQTINLQRYQGEYQSLSDHCSKEIKILGKNKLSIIYKSESQECPLEKSREYFFDCYDLKCVSDKSAPKIPTCEETKLTIDLIGVFNMFDITLSCDGRKLGQKTWVKKSSFSAFREVVEFYKGQNR